MKVEIKESSAEGQSLVEFSQPQHTTPLSFQMPTELARIIKTRCETMELFKHGLRADGKLMGMFREESDMNYCHDLLEDIFADVEWTTQSC